MINDKDKDPSIWCDTWNLWSHTECAILSKTYEKLGNNDLSAWYCPILSEICLSQLKDKELKMFLSLHSTD